MRLPTELRARLFLVRGDLLDRLPSRDNFMIWAAGIGLMAVGVLSLYLSYAVASGWWQGTSQALGVGFIVGGMVDVLALSVVGRVIREADRRRSRINDHLRKLIRAAERDPEKMPDLDIFIKANMRDMRDLDPDLMTAVAGRMFLHPDDTILWEPPEFRGLPLSEYDDGPPDRQKEE